MKLSKLSYYVKILLDDMEEIIINAVQNAEYEKYNNICSICEIREKFEKRIEESDLIKQEIFYLVQNQIEE